MHRHKVVARIFLLLSIVNVTFAGLAQTPNIHAVRDDSVPGAENVAGASEELPQFPGRPSTARPSHASVDDIVPASARPSYASVDDIVPASTRPSYASVDDIVPASTRPSYASVDDIVPASTRPSYASVDDIVPASTRPSYASVDDIVPASTRPSYASVDDIVPASTRPSHASVDGITPTSTRPSHATVDDVVPTVSAPKSGIAEDLEENKFFSSEMNRKMKEYVILGGLAGLFMGVANGIQKEIMGTVSPGAQTVGGRAVEHLNERSEDQEDPLSRSLSSMRDEHLQMLSMMSRRMLSNFDQESGSREG